MTAAEIVKTPSSTNQNSRKKKRKISKHVLQAQEDRLMKQQQPPQADGGQGVAVVPPPASLTTTNSKTNKASTSTSASKKKNKKIKDPNEVANYLTQWKRNCDGHESVWKFNKNTQSWLIRHMYEADKLSKASFSLLLEYLNGLKGGDAKSRILTEATRRAIRYKEYEKVRDELGEKGGSNTGNAVERGAGAGAAPGTDPEGETTTTTTTTQPSLTEEQEEEARWNKLDDHDKRNEYKRARKILDVLKESRVQEP
jgi:hypothetical protein